MKDRRGRIASLAVAAAAFIAPVAGGVAFAQEGEAAQVWSPTWSDEGIAEVAKMLTGSWRTTDAVAEFGSEGESNIAMNVAPIMIQGVPDTLYVETARADSLWEPYRQAVFQLYRYKDQIRLRTYELLTDDVTRAAFAGLYAAPDLFPDLSRDDLIATLDVALTKNGDTYSGSTPYPYPTGVGGAVEMTSEVTLSADRFTTADRGYDASGAIVWGAGANSAYTFERVDSMTTSETREGGVVVIDFVNPGEDTVRQGDKVHTHYTGWLSNGKKFDASRDRGRAFIFDYPSAPGRMIEGWNAAIEGISVGTHRKVFLPWDVAYGERGNPAAGIPSQSDLLFQIECLYLEHPAETGEAEHDIHDGEDHTGHNHP
ncbi:MAG: CpcT/CpeT family chromophore lyase [Phycisphaerales bacterium JB059]